MKVNSKTPDVEEPKRSCKGCARAVVCGILRVHSEYIQKEYSEKGLNPPYKPDEIAQICGYFLPVSAVRLDASPPAPTD